MTIPKQHLDLRHVNIPSSTIPASISAYTEELKAFAARKGSDYKNPEESLRLPFDTNILSDVTHLVQRLWNNQLRYIIVIGIGGSNLGAKAVYDALHGTQDGVLDGYPKLIFLDTVSPRLLLDIERMLEMGVAYPEEIAINLISKSGSTTECIANFEILYAYLSKRFPEIRSRIVVTTDKDGELWKKAEKEGISLLVHQKIGGRFSVFSSVGLFPLALAGIDVESLLSGGKDFLTMCFEKENHALRFAEAIFRAHEHGASIINFFFFNPELESLGKWMRQLYAESLGKEKDKGGKVVHRGITPIVSIGSTDLHSMAQLYLGGPKDKFTLFVHASEVAHFKVPSKGLFGGIIKGIGNKTPEVIMAAIYEGTKAAYTSHKLPFGEVRLPSVSAYTVGMLLEWQMLTVMYLGELMHVNTFDQPNVEDYKKVTRDILEDGSR